MRRRAEAAAALPALGWAPGGGSGAAQGTPRANVGQTRPACQQQQQQQQRRRRRRREGPSSASATTKTTPKPTPGHRQLLLAVALSLLLPAATTTAVSAATPPASVSSAFLRIFYPSASGADPALARSAPLPNPQDPNRDGGRSAPHSAGLAPQSSVTALYCPNGSALEIGRAHV